MSDEVIPHRRFLLTIDLSDFSVRGYPRPHVVDGCIVLLAGHLASGSGDRYGDLRLLARAYRTYGTKLSVGLLGQYAAVVIDVATRRIVLTQDSLGLKPLFYRTDGPSLTASSDLAMLLGHTDVPPLDEYYFAHQFATGFPPRERTPFDGVHRLAYGTTVVMGGSTITSMRPWRPANETLLMTNGEADQRLRELVDDAVASVLPRSGGVVCELSGGLDSSTVLSTVAQMRSDVHALTIISSSGKAGDDDEYARTVADTLGVQRHAIDLDRHPFFSRTPDRFAAESGGELHLALQEAYERVLDDLDAAVVLTGNPGDVIFGYGALPPVHLADDVTGGRVIRALKTARAWAQGEGGTRAWSFYFAHHGVASAWRHIRGHSMLTEPVDPPEWLAGEFVGKHGLRGHIREQPAPRMARPGRQYLWEEVFEIAAGVANASKAISRADFRHPLFYRPLVEFTLALEVGKHRGDGGDRLLQRRAFRDRIPAAVLDRETKGSDQQLREQTLMRNEHFRRLMTVDSRLVQRGWVDPVRWRAMVERTRVGVFDTSLSCESAFLTEIWIRTIEQFAPPATPQLLEPHGNVR